ncbi:carboxypeptidase-like regulatory domain-containing protein [Flavobacterium sp. CS20]|jgi:hypothetical protein|uniref:carboxypeptidase-like regulatory domain-containing protein n=1 Tax=Flavobacterium sp. CS20 TaxID=2775246 RepID=UPI001B3A2828|nr:carboxypeptidase-like regulatory domain-containing protein [Flavobacterium sp. CS20]QTY26165.1 carboxypeptidase-like regulatory domain-containing protein [Flavobacterium sp. CS20]
MRLIQISLCCFFLFLASCQDTNLVSGKIYDNQNQPLDSVKVLVNGTDIYTYSDEKGDFKINTNGLGDELLFDKSGYELKFEELNDNLSDLKILLKQKQ